MLTVTIRFTLFLALMIVPITGQHQCAAAENGAGRPPNVVLFFVDNLGNGDLGCCGSQLHRTPHIDRLACDGTRFTSFYVASGVCTPSRAALLTGCYPRRINLHVNGSNGAACRSKDCIRSQRAQEGTLASHVRSADHVKRSCLAE